MKDFIELIKTIQENPYGWVVFIMAIVALAAIVIVALVALKQGAKSLGERISDSLDNSVNKKSEVRLKELEVRHEELEIQKTFMSASAASVSILNDLIHNTGGGHKVKVTKVTHRRPRNEEFKLNKKEDEKTIQNSCPKAFTRRFISSLM